MTQQLIADATGLTPVHVNRVLKALDNRGVVERTRNRFSIVDWKQLCAIADFDAAYLHNAA
jgi:CRP-like cAMP-binding protein